MKRPKNSGGFELYGVACFAVATFVLLCLISYDPLDPSLTVTTTRKVVNNLGGPAGSYLADALIVSIGLGSFLVPLFLGMLSFSFFLDRPAASRIRLLALLPLFLVFFATALGMEFEAISYREILHNAGGFIGAWGSEWLVRATGRVGSRVLLFCGAVIGIMVLTGLSLKQGVLLLSRAGRGIGSALLKGFVIGSSRAQVRGLQAWKGLKGWWKSYVAARRREVGLERQLKSLKVSTLQSRTPKETLPERPEPSVEAPPPAPPVPGVAVLGDGPKIFERVDLKTKKSLEQLPLPKVTSPYQFPPLSFLGAEESTTAPINEDELKANARLLEHKLLDYGVEGHVTEIHPGPIITMYEFEPAAGVKVGKIVNLEDDLSLIMGGRSIRIVAHLPGKAAVGIEIPNSQRETVWLKDIISSPKFQKAESRLTICLGKDIEGFPFVADLGKMPHLLVAGATGSGKSVSVNVMILSLLYKGTPEEIKMVMVDLKMLELSVYEGIPHLLLPVLTQPKKAALALRWAVDEMERRYEILAERGARNTTGYNKMIEKEGGKKLPLIVIVIDELADLMMTAGAEVEKSIMRLAQMARAAGIHLILATQRPSVDLLTGLIKANFPARISFKVSSKHDSRTILDTVGSEHLLGSGDMLFMAPNTSSQLVRIHGAYVSEKEILQIVDHLKKQGAPVYDEEILKPREDEGRDGAGGDEDEDALYDQAVSLVTETHQASISMIQRRLKVGYNRAARMVERMEREGVIGPADGVRPREVFARGYSGNL